jgi:lanthanide-dependent methanol dehydrogenase
VYYGTGNPGVWNPDVRPGDNKWAASVFARDVDTGQAKWAMQTTPHDEWDYDATNEVILFDNKNKTYATQINKNGFIYTWQADNGSLIAAEKVHPFVNWATSVDLKTGVPSKLATASTHQDYNTKQICPSSFGVKGMNPVAYSPITKLVYAPLYHLCMTYEPVESKYAKGQPWIGATLTRFQGSDTFGSLTAYNPLDGKVAWYAKEKHVTTGGIMTSAGNLVFYNAGDRWFKAMHAISGKELWRFQVGSPSVSNPFSYQHKGKQFIALMTGIGRVTTGVYSFSYPYDGSDGSTERGYQQVKDDWGVPFLGYPITTGNSSGAMLHIFSL